MKKEIEKLYNSKEAKEILEVSIPTLRGYVLAKHLAPALVKDIKKGTRTYPNNFWTMNQLNDCKKNIIKRDLDRKKLQSKKNEDYKPTDSAILAVNSAFIAKK